MFNKNYSEAAVEVLDILNHMNAKDLAKVSKKFITFLNENASRDYICNLDYSKKLNDMDLKKETRGLLAVMYRSYWCPKEELEDLQGKKAICLNEAFEYLGQELGMELITVQTDHEESTMSAEMLRSIIDEVKQQNIEIILIDKNDNKANAETIANETGAKILELNSGLTGSMEKNAYIEAMRENFDLLCNL